MRFEEQVRVPLPAAEAWDFLWQTKRVAACLPGCVAVEEIEPGRRYRADMADSIGPFKAQFNLDITVQETRPQELIRVRASGEDKRLGTSQQMDVTIALRPLGPRETALDITADVLILGKIATLGQFAIKRKAKEVVQRFARNIAAALQPQAARGSDA